MLIDEPDDLFLRYALAMEFRKMGRVEESLAAFATLIDDDPPHVPAFFMAAQLLVGTGQVAQARQFLVDGIRHAGLQGNEHAAAEMAELLASLPPESG
jgi:thioredoxin-like negative regulator of GroEL